MQLRHSFLVVAALAGACTDGHVDRPPPGQAPAVPSKPQPPADLADDPANENTDGDGWCVDPEAGPYACDDGFAEPLPPDPIEPPVDEVDPPPPQGGPVCRDDSFTAAGSARVLLAVDASASMLEEAPGYTGSKWLAASSALAMVSTRLDADDLGLLVFPGPGAQGDVCGIGSLEVTVGPGHGDDIVGALDATEPAGGTPVAATLSRALDVLSVVGADRPRAVVLATDGAPNCNANLDVATCTCVNGPGCTDVRNCLDDADSVAAARALNDLGIPVFVIGIPGSEMFAGVLDALADAGGTALAGEHRHYTADTPTQLSDAVEAAVGRASSCRFDLGGPVADVDDVEVDVDGAPVARDAGRTEGWDLVDSDTVELFGDACTGAAAGATVHIASCFLPPG